MIIYFVTVFDIPHEWRAKPNDELRSTDVPADWSGAYYKRSRCWGWFRDIEQARKCIMENWTDIYENGYYNLAMVEPMSEGICGCRPGEEEFYDAAPVCDAEGYIVDYVVTKVPKPAILDHIVGFSYA